MVSYFLLTFFGKIPTGNPVLEGAAISLIALALFTILVEVPAKFLHPKGDAGHYLLIGALFNALRFLGLGIIVGYLYGRLGATATKRDANG